MGYKVIRAFDYNDRTYEVGEEWDGPDEDKDALFGVFIRDWGEPLGDQSAPAPTEPTPVPAPVAEGEDQLE